MSAYNPKYINGFGPRLPLINSGTDTIRTFKDEARQNFINLCLTIPGERVMDNNFGIGMKSFLFEPNDEFLRAKISERIVSQTSEYLPYINILDISFSSYQNDNTLPEDYLKLRIKYEIQVDNVGIDQIDFDVADSVVTISTPTLVPLPGHIDSISEVVPSSDISNDIVDNDINVGRDVIATFNLVRPLQTRLFEF